LTTQVRLPNSTAKLIKRVISNREKGVFKKGHIMDFVNKAVLDYIGAENQTSREKSRVSTHARYTIRALELNQRIVNWLRNRYQYETLSGVTIAKSTLEEAIIALDGCIDQRSINARITLLKSERCIKESDDSNKVYRRYKFLM
jgi:hypothetical protein